MTISPGGKVTPPSPSPPPIENHHCRKIAIKTKIFLPFINRVDLCNTCWIHTFKGVNRLLTVEQRATSIPGFNVLLWWCLELTCTGSSRKQGTKGWHNKQILCKLACDITCWKLDGLKLLGPITRRCDSRSWGERTPFPCSWTPRCSRWSCELGLVWDMRSRSHEGCGRHQIPDTPPLPVNITLPQDDAPLSNKSKKCW